LKEFDKNLLKERVQQIRKKMLTVFKPSDTLSKSLEGDNKKQIVTTKVVKENGL